MTHTTDPVLVLGGTAEARTVVQFLVLHTKHPIIVSLAGVLGTDPEKAFRQRGDLPSDDRLSFSVGGFGGSAGLVRYITSNSIAAIIDATHPFAHAMSTNACAAAAQSGIQIIRYTRAPWSPVEGDLWIQVSSLEEAAEQLIPHCIAMLAVGRLSFDPFRHRTDCHLVVRSIGDIDPSELPGHAEHVRSMPGQTVEEELSLMQSRSVECLVTKNSGASQSYLKVVAARRLRLPVIMIERPVLPECLEITDTTALDRWLLESDLKV
ncbi:precorrin-6A/cobalt-precorrin-6A reductase [Cohaesibacter sp. ES.047]|uniref:precorrin-6A/cobalt-precorrin-6A reductase n=1 Tax=Cohaesibacter sp. ES.047 TaxID=1798205 RepID=UPI000BC0E191|nr:precorrin-6A/cobalt-precorrin-6A reductase [Cohaesibacter sp. ES.047]SNY93561.1 precorrin-6A/cobalt-precorrin-6A reductase [Cohaesibacter sp. ES.047]